MRTHLMFSFLSACLASRWSQRHALSAWIDSSDFFACVPYFPTNCLVDQLVCNFSSSLITHQATFSLLSIFALSIVLLHPHHHHDALRHINWARSASPSCPRRACGPVLHCKAAPSVRPTAVEVVVGWRCRHTDDGVVLFNMMVWISVYARLPGQEGGMQLGQLQCIRGLGRPVLCV